MEIYSLGKEPIQPDQPTGSDARYEPEYEQLQAEIDKLSVPSASGGVDWKKVSDLAALILDKKSKDLLVASYLAVSQVHLRQIHGFADGLTVIHDLIDQYWGNLFPAKKRMRGRLGAIEWWIEKTETALEGIKPDPVAAEKLEGINMTLSRIDALIQEYFPEPPLLRPIQRVIDKIPSLSEEKREAEPTPDAEPAQTKPLSESEPETEIVRETPKAAPATTEPEPLATEQDAQRLINAGLQKIRQAAAFLLEIGPMNPTAFRYRRITAWSPILALPPESNGQTQIPSPAPQIRQALMDLKDKGNWNALITSAEQSLSQYFFWFDLNRFVSESLVSLGESYRSSHEAVCQETSFFLHRLPGAADLAFSDGTPFADPETKEWLESIALGGGTLTPDSVQRMEIGGEEEDGDKHMANTLEKAQELAKKKRLLDAVQLIQAEIKNCFSQKEVLIWRFALCRMLIGSKRSDMALPHLDLILNDIEAYRLENWEPQLALEGLKLLWTGYNNHTDKTFKRNAEAILSRITRLDSVEALKLCQT
jgi:type VI secretion system protein VasJ